MYVYLVRGVESNNQYVHILNYYVSYTSENIRFSDYKNKSLRGMKEKVLEKIFLSEQERTARSENIIF